MYPYQPKPWHLITVAFPLFAIGVYSLKVEWGTLGFISIALGFIATALISLAHIWENANEHLNAKRNLIDTARHLDLDRMAAIGLTVGEPKQTTNIRITETDRYGNFKSETRIPNLPISPVKMQSVANAIINDNAPFSRPEIATKRGILTDTEFRKLKKVLEDKNLLIKKNDDSDTAGSVLTPIGRKTFQSYLLPSPTPDMETAQNG
jgi:hypothetical protein